MTKPKKPVDAGRKAADRAVQFINNLTHTKSPWGGQKFNLRPWQENQIIRPLFGTLRPDGLRQYRTCFLMLPRKNGKGELASAIALYLLLGCDEQGGEIYGGAADRQQASLIFDVAAQMIRNDPELSARCRIIDSTKRIINPSTGSFYRVISAEAYTKFGFNPSAVIVDEVHALPDRSLWEALTTGMGARREPLTLAITTAGWDRNSLAYELFDYGRKVRDGIVKDPTFLPIIYQAPDDADWTDPAVWQAANPALGDFLRRDDMERAAADALELPIRQNAFRRLRLNQWTECSDRWMDVGVWNESAGQIDADDLKGPVVVGLDLAATQDMSAMAVLFPHPAGGYSVLMRYWLPGHELRQRADRDHAPYVQWRDEGYLTCTEGNLIDYAVVERDIMEIHERFGIRELCFDRYNSSALITRVQQQGVTCVPVGQGYLSMAAPVVEFERLVLSKQLRHGGNPILAWNLANTQLEMDAAGNRKPSKAKSTGRIDGISSLLTGLFRCITKPPEEKQYQCFFVGP